MAEVTQAEIDRLNRLAPEFPEKIEFEPGKIAIYDPERCCWIYRDPDSGLETIIRY